MVTFREEMFFPQLARIVMVLNSWKSKLYLFNHFFSCELQYTEKGIKQLHNFMNHFKEKTVITIQLFPSDSLSLTPEVTLPCLYGKHFFSFLSFYPVNINLWTAQFHFACFSPLCKVIKEVFKSFFWGGVSVLYMCLYNIYIYMYWMSILYT